MPEFFGKKMNIIKHECLFSIELKSTKSGKKVCDLLTFHWEENSVDQSKYGDGVYSVCYTRGEVSLKF
jgi:hypothetical protein